MTKYFRSILSCLLAIVLIAGMLPLSVSAADSTAFSDISPSDWYAAPVQWAVDNNITGGIGEGKFGPTISCTRAQVVTFLWAAEGRPEPQSLDNPFQDVAEDAWYFKPVLWAVEQGITRGTSANTFSPEQKCTRGQIVTFLYAAAGKPAVQTTESPFTDVKTTDWFAVPVFWAKENGITDGINEHSFGPHVDCVRAQVVTFLFKFYADEAEVTPPTYNGVGLSFESPVSVEKGRLITVPITAIPGDCPELGGINYEIADNNIILCAWDSTEGYTMNLLVLGNAVGSTTITLTLVGKDRQTLAVDTLEVNVTEPTLETKPEAFHALQDWVMANGSPRLDGGVDVIYTDEKDGDVYEYALIVPEDESCVYLSVRLIDKELEFSLMMTLERYYDISYSSLYIYYTPVGADEELIYAGMIDIYKPDYHISKPLSFEDATLTQEDLETYNSFLNYLVADGLEFLSYILMQNTPYTLLDLGFTGYYG